jgi:transposase
MKSFLTPEQRQSLKLAHRQTSQRRVADRIKVVLLADQGESIPQIAKFLLINKETAYLHLKDYRKSGKLQLQSGGSEGKLTHAQSLELCAVLVDCEVSDVSVAIEQAQTRFGVTFSISGMTNWLKRYGFSFKKVSPSPPKQTPKRKPNLSTAIPSLPSNCRQMKWCFS